MDRLPGVGPSSPVQYYIAFQISRPSSLAYYLGSCMDAARPGIWDLSPGSVLAAACPASTSRQGADRLWSQKIGRLQTSSLRQGLCRTFSACPGDLEFVPLQKQQRLDVLTVHGMPSTRLVSHEAGFSVNVT